MTELKKNAIIMLVFIAGLAIFLYPRIQNEVSWYKHEKEIAMYDRSVDNLSEQDKSKRLSEAESYNGSLNTGVTSKRDPFLSSAYQKDRPLSFLKSDDIFGYLEIPKLGENLPIYLGASHSHLARGVGQVESTSYPVGGTDSHSVLAGHRGYSASTMFRYIDRLEKGDRFYVNVYGERMAYEVIGQEIITPDQVDKFGIYPGEDRVTLLSCHPYPNNTHRILVYGTRVSELEAEVSSERKGSEDSKEDNKDEPQKQTKVIAEKTVNRIIVVVGLILIAAIMSKLIKNIIELRKKKLL